MVAETPILISVSLPAADLNASHKTQSGKPIARMLPIHLIALIISPPSKKRFSRSSFVAFAIDTNSMDSHYTRK